MGATFDAVASQVWRRQQCKMSNDFERCRVLSFRVEEWTSSTFGGQRLDLSSPTAMRLTVEARTLVWRNFFSCSVDSAALLENVPGENDSIGIMLSDFPNSSSCAAKSRAVTGPPKGNRCGFPWSADGCLAAHYISLAKRRRAAFQSSLVHGSSSCTLPILRQFRRRTWPFLTPRYEGAMFELSIFWRQLCGVIDKSCFAPLLFCLWMVSTGFLIKWGIGVASHGARIDIRLTSSPSSVRRWVALQHWIRVFA